MIEFKNVSKVYDNGSVALDDVCLTINDGEFVLVCGHSGAGKSTLFKLLTHEVVPDAGTVIVDVFNDFWFFFNNFKSKSNILCYRFIRQ